MRPQTKKTPAESPPRRGGRGGRGGVTNRRHSRARRLALRQSLKADQQLSPKPERQQSPKPDQQPSLKPVQQPNDQARIAAASAPPNTLSIDFQAIASAYGDYTKRSFEETRCFVEKLSGARSLDKAIEIQTEFAKQAYETFVTESQKIRELYSGLAKQSFKPFEGFVTRTIEAAH